ncbi:hypothetical protein PINS_up002113 [Pythium insidiosum]|nr:hypothetical protein PINS_up002113 [Pythium insidiosum]
MATTEREARATGIGKVHYMAPEACETQRQSYDPFRADVWSLGVILLTLLTGRYPFEEPREGDANFRLLSLFGVEYLLERCDFETAENHDIVELLERMLAIDPLKRDDVATLLKHRCFDEFHNEEKEYEAPSGAPAVPMMKVVEPSKHSFERHRPTAIVTALPSAPAVVSRPPSLPHRSSRRSQGPSPKLPRRPDRVVVVVAPTASTITAAKRSGRWHRRSPTGDTTSFPARLLRGVFQRKKAPGPSPSTSSAVCCS